MSTVVGMLTRECSRKSWNIIKMFAKTASQMKLLSRSPSKAQTHRYETTYLVNVDKTCTKIDLCILQRLNSTKKHAPNVMYMYNHCFTIKWLIFLRTENSFIAKHLKLAVKHLETKHIKYYSLAHSFANYNYFVY